jgi:hypothetical protein
MLVEVLIAVAFIGALGSLVAGTMFQSLKADSQTSGRITVADQVARASRWIARDGHRSTSTNIADGAAAVNTATFQWDSGGSPVSCQYAVSSGLLVRTCNGTAATVASAVANLAFARTGRLITASFDVVHAGNVQNVSLSVLQGGY